LIHSASVIAHDPCVYLEDVRMRPPPQRTSEVDQLLSRTSTNTVQQELFQIDLATTVMQANVSRLELAKSSATLDPSLQTASALTVEHVTLLALVAGSKGCTGRQALAAALAELELLGLPDVPLPTSPAAVRPSGVAEARRKWAAVQDLKARGFNQSRAARSGCLKPRFDGCGIKTKAFGWSDLQKGHTWKAKDCAPYPVLVKVGGAAEKPTVLSFFSNIFRFSQISVRSRVTRTQASLVRSTVRRSGRCGSAPARGVVA